MSEDKTAKYDWTDKAPEIAGRFVQVAGVLAGFSITAVILIAGVLEKQPPDPSDTLGPAAMGMFLIAFFGHISAAVLFSMVSGREGAHRRFLFVAATCLFYMTGLFSFAALLPLLHIIGRISHLRIAMGLLLSSSVFGGYFGIAFPARDLLGLDLKHCFRPLLIAMLASMPLILVATLLALLDKQVLLQCILIFPLLVGAAIYVFSMVTFLGTWVPRDSDFGWFAMATMGITTTAVIFSIVATALLVLVR
jgi:hypothetical protein